MSVLFLHIIILFHANAIGVAKAQDFLLYGYVNLLSEYANCLCHHQLTVQIGNHIWHQPLKWRSYAFKVPQNSENLRVGVLSLNIYRHEEFVKSLWTEYFVIQQGGEAQRLDICTVDREPSPCACQQSIGTAEETQADDYAPVLVRSSHYSGGYGFSCPPCECQCKCKEEEIMMAPLTMLLLPGNATAIHGVLRGEGKGKDHVFLHWIVLGFAVVRAMIQGLGFRLCALEGREGESESESMLVEREARKNWELSAAYGDNVKNKGMLVCGEGTFEEAWAWTDAEHDLLSGVNGDCCFYFNSTTARNDMKIMAAEGEGLWNRDAHGRLTRLSTMSE